jgi:hypothetical protein
MLQMILQFPITQKLVILMLSLQLQMQVKVHPWLNLIFQMDILDFLAIIIGSISEGVQTRSKAGLINTCLFSAFLSQTMPENY